MHLNDLEEYLSSSSAGLTVGHFRLLLLLYAGDVVLFANNRGELFKIKVELSSIVNTANGGNYILIPESQKWLH